MCVPLFCAERIVPYYSAYRWFCCLGLDDRVPDHTSHRLYSLELQCEPADVLGEGSASVRASFFCGPHRALLLHFVHTHCMNDEASLSKLITVAVEEACRHGLDSIRQTEGQ